MAEEKSYSGGIAVIVKQKAIDMFSRKCLDNFYEATEISGDTEPRQVFARLYKRSPGMKYFFGLMEKARGRNILEVISVTAHGDDQVITFEPFCCTLEGFLKKNMSAVFLPPIVNQLTEFSPRFMMILRGIINGVGHLHSLGITHGSFSQNAIYLAYDGTARLGLWDHEAEAYYNWEITDHSKSKDWVNLGKLIVEICDQLCPELQNSLKCRKEFHEVSDLVCSLIDGSLCSEEEILLHPALWTTRHKRQFFHNARRVLNCCKHRTVKGWFDHFSEGIQYLPEKYRHYHPHSLCEFHRFGRNVMEHIYDGDPGMEDVRKYFGKDQDSVMRRLQLYYPLLFKDLISIAITQKLIDQLVLNEADAVVPFPEARFTFSKIVPSTMDLKEKSQLLENEDPNNSLAANSSNRMCDLEGSSHSSEGSSSNNSLNFSYNSPEAKSVVRSYLSTGATIFETKSNSEPKSEEKRGTENTSDRDRSSEPTSVPKNSENDSSSNSMGEQGRCTEKNVETNNKVNPTGLEKNIKHKKKKNRKQKNKR